MADANAAAAVAAPKCAVCNHHHEQGIKCTICGHTGKSRGFHMLRVRSRAGVFSTKAFDCLTRTPVIRNLDRNYWAFTKILRGRIFPDTSVELTDDPNARHIVAFVGDAPIGTARWRLTSEYGSAAVEISLLGILEEKRRRGHGKQLLQHLIEDINTRLVELGASCHALIAHIPEHDAIGALRMFEVAGFQLDPQCHQRRGQSYFRAIMLAPA